MNFPTRFADCLDNGLEQENGGILVNLQQNGTLGGLGIP